MEEKILTFECSKCGYPKITFDVNFPAMGHKCPECNFAHMFKRQKEFECSTLILNVESEIAKEVTTIKPFGKKVKTVFRQFEEKKRKKRHV